MVIVESRPRRALVLHGQAPTPAPAPPPADPPAAPAEPVLPDMPPQVTVPPPPGTPARPGPIVPGAV